MMITWYLASGWRSSLSLVFKRGGFECLFTCLRRLRSAIARSSGVGVKSST